MKKFLIFALAIVAFAACGEKEEPTKTLELAGGGTTQEQTFYKDEVEETGGFAFYAPAPWTAQVDYSTTSRADGDAWLRLKLNGVEATSGPAGNMTLTIEMDANDTEFNRSATITIDCGGSQITVTVTQDARTTDQAKEDGDYEERPDVPKQPDVPKPQPVNMRYVATITMTVSDTGTGGTDPGGDPQKPVEKTVGIGHVAFAHAAASTRAGEEKATFHLSYDSQNRLTSMDWTSADKKEWERYTWKWSADKVEMSSSMRFAEYAEGGTPGYGTDVATAVYTIGSNGYATSGTSTWTYTDSYGSGKEMSDTQTLTYNNGYLSTWTAKDRVASYTWTDGNLTKVTYSQGSETGSATFGYGNVTNNTLCNLDLNTLFTGSHPNVMLVLVRMAGMSSDRMASGSQHQDAYDVSSYTYQLDSQGYVTKVTRTYEYGDTDTVTITYR